jgi:hypothetical protein
VTVACWREANHLELAATVWLTIILCEYHLPSVDRRKAPHQCLADSSKFLHLFREIHPTQQALESRILTEGIESGILFEETDERPWRSAPQAAGQRYIGSGPFISRSEIVTVQKERLG